MSYQVIARKWRPQSFQELVGQDHISTTLLNAIRHNRLPQALLFTGVRGTGKTSTARIVAKSLRCPNAIAAGDAVPCNQCPTCTDISEGRSLDVIEIDGASNNGVDAVRELRETVGYMPSSGRYKVYIIDEVHMLSTSAFNALLKTLEEPPPHVVFIMATTEVQKIPNTILSRCQRFDFRRIPSRQIATHLEKISAAENVKFETEALWLIARQGDGSLRDSQSLLDQVITFCDGTVTLAKVVEVLGLTDRTLLLEALAALVTRDSLKTVRVIEKIFQSGFDPKLFAQDLLEEIRNALMVRLAGDSVSALVDLPDSEIQHLLDLTQSLSEEDLHLLFDMTLKGVGDILRAQDTRLVLEMLLLRMAAAPRIANLEQLLHEPQARAVPAKTASANASLAAQPSQVSRATASTTAPPQPAASKPAPEAEDSEALKARPNDPWFRFVEKVKNANGLLGAMLENTHLIQTDGSRLVIGMPKKMGFLFDKLNEPENLKRIEAFLESLWNKKYTVEMKLADPSSETISPKTAVDQHTQAKKKTLEEQVEKNPLVRSAKTAFKTQVKSIKENT